MTHSNRTTIQKIEAEFLSGDISYADYRRDLHHYYQSVLKPEATVDWKDRAATDNFGFDRSDRGMGR